MHEAMDLDVDWLPGFSDAEGDFHQFAPRRRFFENRRGGYAREPSPFCHEILNSNPYYLSRRRSSRRAPDAGSATSADVVARKNASGLGALDAGAIAQVAEESWPVIRDADELHDALLTLVIFPADAELEAFFDELKRDGRAKREDREGKIFWIATERIDRASNVEADPAAVLRGWMVRSVRSPRRSWRSGWRWPVETVERCFPAQLESEGQILRENFSAEGNSAIIACARIHPA